MKRTSNTKTADAVKKLFIPVFTATSLFAFSMLLTAEEIALPDVTTVVSGGEVKIGKDALPDFSDVVSDEKTAVPSVVKMPEMEESKTSSLGVPVQVQEKSKELFVEGKVGGGMPGFFTGSFNIYKQSEENPFQLSFSHETADGYFTESASDGYFDNSTQISGEKTFSLSNGKLDFSAFYDKNDKGTQGISRALNDVAKQNIGAQASVSIDATDNCVLSFGSGTSVYSRYGGKKDTSLTDKYELEALTFDLTPWINAAWSFNDFKIELKGDYKQQNNLKSKDYITFAELDEQATYRGCAGTKLTWANETFTVFEEVSAVFGNKLGEKRSVIIPFTAGLQVSAEPDFLDGEFSFSVKGGLDSYQSSYSQLEKMYDFAVLGFFPEETTDWYVESELSLPVSRNVEIGSSVEYRKTAYENGVWEADYDNKLASKLYGFTMQERELLKTRAEVTFKTGAVTVNAGWERHWKDIPVLEAKNLVEVEVGIQSEDLKRGISVNAGLENGEDTDKDPIIGVDGFIRLTPALQLAVQAEDLVKFAAREKRYNVGDYYARGGSAALLVKFNF